MRSDSSPIGIRQPQSAWIRHGVGAPGIERLEAQLNGRPFAPHRHDHYAIGVTLGGVQTFMYRGVQRHCVEGEGHVLHPDELHDGAAGTEAGFRYRILYVDPALVREAVGEWSLPFVADPVIDRDAISELTSIAFTDLDAPIDELQRLDLMLGVAHLLQRRSRQCWHRGNSLALDRLRRVREFIVQNPAAPMRLSDLETVSGLDRWTIARQFRAAYGTSPTYFRTMRQLELARAQMLTGQSFADAALASGFADQSHFTRKFKRAYGMTPACWLAATRAARA